MLSIISDLTYIEMWTDDVLLFRAENKSEEDSDNGTDEIN